MNLFSWLPSRVSEAEVRAEVWNLGVRHHGEPLAGALEELKTGQPSAERAQLLHACVRKLKRAQTT